MVDMVKAAATAKRLIEANGRSVTIFKKNRDPDNPAKPWHGTSGVPTTPEGGAVVTATVAFVPATGAGFGKMIRDLDGSLDVAFDQIGLLASDSIVSPATPEDVERADSVRDGSDLWKIETRGHLKPGGTSIMFVLGLKR